MLNKKILFIIGIIIAVFIIGAVVLFLNKNEESILNNNSSGFVIGNNAIYVAEQEPTDTVSVWVARFEKPGFVVIHEDAAGSPGKILGISPLLLAGENKNLPPIKLSRKTTDGETIYAMLHLDNGDGKFDAANDKPALDSVGGSPVMMVVDVSNNATEPGAVNL